MTDHLHRSYGKKLLLPLLLFLLLFLAISSIFSSQTINKQRKTPEYKAAREYLITSEAFQKMQVSQDRIQLRQFNEVKSRCKADQETKHTLKYGFFLGEETIDIVGHQTQEGFRICPDCSEF